MQSHPDAEAYFEALPPERKEILLALRKVIEETLPAETRETMSYRLPTYELEEQVCALGAQKHYLCLYVCNIPALDAHREAFDHLNCGKSCIRFRRLEDLPLDAVRKVVAHAAAHPGPGHGRGR